MKNHREIDLVKNGPILIWLTGLPCSGKTTIATRVEELLNASGILSVRLDGDDLREGLCKDLGFSDLDRHENIRRAGEVARLFLDKGFIVLAAFISPFISDRESIRKSLPKGEFVEVFVNCPVHICEQRDVKGNYASARIGLKKNFTGIDSPYQNPTSPEIEIHTDVKDVEESAAMILDFIYPRISLIHKSLANTAFSSS